MNKKINIIYTSDTHGRLSAYDFLNKTYGSFGLSRLPSFLKSLQEPYLLLDNGDFLQGSPLLDYTRTNDLANPVVKLFNSIKYDYVTLGNHDFNYGLNYLNSFKKGYHGQILCANIYQDEKPLFKSHVIHEIDGIKIAIIGLVTEYIPFWEKPDNIPNLKFLDVVETTKKVIFENDLKSKSDLIVVLYHGGFEKDLVTNESFGPQTVENKGYELFLNEDIDILLTGHQHIPKVYKRNQRVTLQTSHNAKDFGLVTISLNISEEGILNKTINGSIKSLSEYPIDDSSESLIAKDIQKTNDFLSKQISRTSLDMSITSSYDCRVKKHPLFQLVNQIQLEYTKADISVSSLPNETHGFPTNITLNDVAVNFPYENDLVVLEVTGEILKSALEQNATYFSLDNNQIIINPKFLYPKVEHYNYDVYDGIEYVIDVSQPIGQRVTLLKFNNQDIKPNDRYELAINSYRAVGSGGFDMFKRAKRIISYPISYFDLIQAYLTSHPNLEFSLIENFKIIH